MTVRPALPDGLYLISDEGMIRQGQFLPFLKEALAAGLHIVQLRAKTVPRDEMMRVGRQTRALTREAGAVFIVNDSVEAALELDADGVHLGQEDLAPREARRLTGESLLIGWSTHNREQIAASAGLPVDYIGIGPVFPTTTKDNPDPVVGLDLLGWAREHGGKPIVAIGGISVSNAGAVIRAGANMAAVVAAIGRASDPLAALHDFMREINAALG